MVLAAVALVAIAGSLYERNGARRDRERLPQVGTSVDIGGRSLNIFCSGEGSPAVIFDSGNMEAGYTWSHIQPRIASFTRACWFDRAGLGWSDLGPFPRDSAAMSADLHELMRRAQVPPPYVLVGHSLGGLNVRVYNGAYPGEVAGAVLVDAAHEDEARRAPAFMLGHTAARFLWRPVWFAGRMAHVLGIIRVLGPSVDLPGDPKMRSREQIVAALREQPKSVATRFDTSAPDCYAQAERAGGFGDKPLVVLTRGRVPSVPATASDEDRQFAAYEKVWMHEIQPKLARLSTRGRQVIVAGSGHMIPDEAPDAVIDAVRQVVADVRGVIASESAQVYGLLLSNSYHGVPAHDLVIKNATVPMRPLRVRQQDRLPEELRELASVDKPTPLVPLAPGSFPLGARFADSTAIDAHMTALTSGDPSDFRGRFGAHGYLGVSDILYTRDRRDALVYYESWCGGLCGEGGYLWAHRDTLADPWRVGLVVVSWVS